MLYLRNYDKDSFAKHWRNLISWLKISLVLISFLSHKYYTFLQVKSPIFASQKLAYL